MAGNRKYGIGVVEVMGLQMILARLVGFGRRRRSRGLARRRAWGCVRSDLPRHRGGFRPQGGLGRQAYGGPDPRRTRAVTPAKAVASAASP